VTANFGLISTRPITIIGKGGGRVKKLFLIPLVLVLLGGLIVCGCPAQVSPEQPIEIVYQAVHPRPQFLTQEVILPYLTGLEEQSGGRIKVTYYDAGGVVPLPGTMDAIATNVLQMGTTYTPIEPGRYPLADVTSQPFTTPGSTIASQVVWHLYETFPEWQAEYPSDVVVLTMFTSALNQIHTVNKPITSLDDLRGMDIIGLAPTTLEVLSMAGANPISLLIQDSYEAMDKGVAEGIICPLAPIKALKISEIAPYHTIINLSCDAFTISMNREVFESMPKDLQQLVTEEAGAKISKAAGYGLDVGSVDDAQWMKDEGGEFYVLTEGEMAKFVDLVTPMVENWVADMEAKGKPGRAVLDEALSYGQTLEAQGEYIPEYPID
jgi:TRAP-type C4-dicarboxylate transport system substrate-binding protein